MMCAGCAGSNPAGVARLDTSLPPAPDYMSPVPVTPVHEGQDPKDALATRTGELSEANSRLGKSRQWYSGVRKEAARPSGGAR